MNILVWILFGALSGWIASIITRINASQGLLADVIMGVIGALAGGFIMSLFDQPGVTGFNLYSIAVAVIGAVILISIGRMFTKTA